MKSHSGWWIPFDKQIKFVVDCHEFGYVDCSKIYELLNYILIIYISGLNFVTNNSNKIFTI